MYKYAVAVVGAGPAGYFTVQQLQKAQNEAISFSIDMIERLPTPWGLVRSGVAPDHSKIKTVAKVFEKIASEKDFRLFANVEVGKDVSIKDLRENYDVVVLATGCAAGRKLGIVGEDLSNCLSAAQFVPWYNAHPDFTDISVDLNTDTAVVIGAGNVAMDVGRLLAIDPSELEATDIAENALAVLKLSKIKKVIICGRRGPEHAAFTATELRDLAKLDHTEVCIDIDQLNAANLRLEQMGEVERELKNNLEIMRIITESRKKGARRKLEINFLLTPIEIKGTGKVEEIVFTINEVIDGKVESTGRTFSIKTGLVITAIGYIPGEISGIKIDNGKLANIAGHIEQNIYVTGWAKRGSIGIIGTNKSDSADVVDLIIRNLKRPKNVNGIDSLLNSRHRVIDQVGWGKINASEVIAGELAGKPRIKEANWERLIDLGTA